MRPTRVVKEPKIDPLRSALLDAFQGMQQAKQKAARAKREFSRARTPDTRKRARRLLVAALGDLRTSTLAQEVAVANLRRSLSPLGRAQLEDVLARLNRTLDHYSEVSQLFDEHASAYDGARHRYAREREALGRRARVPLKFDALLADLEAALSERDKALTSVHAAHRRTLEALSKAFAAGDEHSQRPTPSNRLRREEALSRARRLFGDAERSTQNLARALSAWFEADKQFSLAISALEAARGFAEIQRLQLCALDMLRASARLSLATIVTDEALASVTGILAEVRALK